MDVGLWLGLVLDGKGGATELEWASVAAWRNEQGPAWIHLNPNHAVARAWLSQQWEAAGLEGSPHPGPARRAHLQPLGAHGFLISLRGLAPDLNNPQEDLATIHIWVKPDRAISFAERSLPNVQTMVQQHRERRGAKTLAGLFVNLAEQLADSLRNAVLDLEDPMADVEYTADGAQEDPEVALRLLERNITRLRQHVAPMKILLSRIDALPRTWLFQEHSDRWRHLADELHEADSQLQSLKERASAVRDSIRERLSRRANYVLYVLTILSAIMLPLTFLTSLLGMNVGISGASYRRLEPGWTLPAVFLFLLVVAWGEYILIRRRRLL